MEMAAIWMYWRFILNNFSYKREEYFKKKIKKNNAKEK